jgi:hypothetical protein
VRHLTRPAVTSSAQADFPPLELARAHLHALAEIISDNDPPLRRRLMPGEQFRAASNKQQLWSGDAVYPLMCLPLASGALCGGAAPLQIAHWTAPAA